MMINKFLDTPSHFAWRKAWLTLPWCWPSGHVHKLLGTGLGPQETHFTDGGWL